MTYRLHILREGARERFGDEDFASFDSAMEFALNYFPEEVDFEIEEVEVALTNAIEQPGLAKIVTAAPVTSAHDEPTNVISLCNYRKVKHGIAV